jgi:acylphosphatase
METSAVLLKIQGRVQGVYYRASAQSKAQGLGLTGWVKNSPKGIVESHAEGSKEKLEEFINWCRQGPPAASVSSVDSDWISPKGYQSFEIR